MKILVCGGAGYIGSHMVRHLRECGHEVVVFDNLSTGHREAIDGVTRVEGDVRDAAALDRVFADHAFDAVMHFCARSLAGESVTEPSAYYDNNVSGTLGLLGAPRRAGDPPVLVASSARAELGWVPNTPTWATSSRPPGAGTAKRATERRVIAARRLRPH